MVFVCVILSVYQQTKDLIGCSSNVQSLQLTIEHIFMFVENEYNLHQILLIQKKLLARAISRRAGHTVHFSWL